MTRQLYVSDRVAANVRHKRREFEIGSKKRDDKMFHLRPQMICARECRLECWRGEELDPHPKTPLEQIEE